MNRDSQRQRVYAAEFALRDVLDNGGAFDFFGSKLTLPVERKFGTVESVQNYVDRVLALNWVRDNFPQASVPVRVRARKGQEKAHYCASEIAVPVGQRWALREVVVLHEVAHHLARGDRHGPEFAGAFHTLVAHVIGPEAGLVARWLYDVNGVTVCDKKYCQIA